MVIPSFDISMVYGTAPCPACSGGKVVWTSTVTVPSDEEWARQKLYGEYDRGE